MVYCFRGETTVTIDDTCNDLTFQAVDWHAEDSEDLDSSFDDGCEAAVRYVIKIYGVTTSGHSVAATVYGFKPFFYFELPDSWSAKVLDTAVGQMKNRLNDSGSFLFEHRILLRSKFVGFQNGKQYRFARLTFFSLRGMQRYLKLLEKPISITGLCPQKLILYETSRDLPLLRFLHCQDLKAAGWITLKAGEFVIDESGNSRCQISVFTTDKQVIACERESIAPIIVASFDIEADSSHGDFPQAQKTYRKLALELIDLCQRDQSYLGGSKIQQLITGAFSITPPQHISRVYSKSELAPLQSQARRAAQAVVVFIENVIYLRDCLQSKVDIKLASAHQDIQNLLFPEKEVQNLSKKFTFHSTEEKEETVLKAMDRLITEMTEKLDEQLPTIEGDRVIQIGTTVTVYGRQEVVARHVVALNTCDAIPDVIVESKQTEQELLLAWCDFIQKVDPDVVTGWNTFGFDFRFMFERAQELGIESSFGNLGRDANVLSTLEKKNLSSSAMGDNEFFFIQMRGRVNVDLMKAITKNPAIKLDSYKLDNVGSHFMRGNVTDVQHTALSTRIGTKSTYGLREGTFVSFLVDNGIIEDSFESGQKFVISDVQADSFVISETLKLELGGDNKVFWAEGKDDISAKDIFRMQLGSSADRALIAKYCVQDCELVGRLANKLDILPNAMAMANVCHVPLSYLFLRGQGIKSFSLVAKQARKDKFLIQIIDKSDEEKDQPTEGYEGAIVLDPITDIHYDCVAVSDFASLYPSSIISENLSHETFVNDPRYEGIRGIEYCTISYDNYEFKKLGRGAKLTKVINKSEPVKKCTFVRPPRDQSGNFIHEKRGVIPRILMALLQERKNIKKRMKAESDPFKLSVLDSAQLAAKITANSLYGQLGAVNTSAVALKELAASCTATGRKNLLFARDYMKETYGATAVYGDTDSVFMKFDCRHEDGTKMKGLEAVRQSMALCVKACNEVSERLDYPHSLCFEKVISPFILLSKKRYCGGYFEDEDQTKPKIKYMGISLKRRDNAPIVKHFYAGIVDILLRDVNREEVQKLLSANSTSDIKRHLVHKAQEFIRVETQKLLAGQFREDRFILSKSLKSEYKNPQQIAHKVLADRANERGSDAFLSSDRVPFIYFFQKEIKGRHFLSGDRIETPEFITQNNLKIDFKHYLTNQIAKPIAQVFGLALEQMQGFDENRYTSKQLQDRDAIAESILFDRCLQEYENRLNGNVMLTEMYPCNELPPIQKPETQSSKAAVYEAKNGSDRRKRQTDLTAFVRRSLD